TGEGRPGLAATLRALNEALGRPEGLWVKESGARKLRHRDFLAPRAALSAAFPGGQVGRGGAAATTRLSLSPRVGVRLVPALPEEGSPEVLRQLRIDWPSSSGGSALPDAISALKQALGRSPCATACEQAPGAAALPEDVICKVRLKSFVEQQGLVGYDPNLDVLLVTDEKLRSLAELQQAVLQGTVSNPVALPASRFRDLISFCQGSCCSVVHVVSCEEEFQQQQLDLLWRILDPGAHTALQKHLVCGPVKVTNPSSPIGADQYFQLRKHQMHEASVMKYGELAEDESWTEVIDTLTVAAIRFEMLSTAHRSQITLDLEDSSISTKGTKSGAFVMYNCARLATLFDTYQRAVERGEHQSHHPPLTQLLLGCSSHLEPQRLLWAQQSPTSFPGTYPPLPPASELNFSCLREEVRAEKGNAGTCVPSAPEPFPHLFDQMFARLQLLGAVRDMFHSALATLHLPPLSQI
ncbi:DALD3 protein, partial [Glareola pratincola]|nr:DALD3 protein [Glareola pratincola]